HQFERALFVGSRGGVLSDVRGERALELMRLDRLQAAAWPAVLKGDLRAIDTVVRIISTRAKIRRDADAAERGARQATPVAEVSGIADLTERIAARRGAATG
uniref:hypothetical protein n=1 Tax=Amycolatopsis pretoriensis TaxID=218821 RepID=UPI001B80034B